MFCFLNNSYVILHNKPRLGKRALEIFNEIFYSMARDAYLAEIPKVFISHRNGENDELDLLKQIVEFFIV